MLSQQNACLQFRRLHETGCFVIPNPWDAGSARVLAQLGFRALATTSAGFAWSQGRADHHITLNEALEHFRSIATTVDLPVSADFAAAFAVEPEKVAENVAAAATTGIAGLSVEDGSRESDRPLFEFDLAVERIRAARRAINAGNAPLVLTARSEGFIVGRPDLAETIRRLTAFAEAGADCVYAPGIRTKNEIVAIVSAVSPTPVNVVVGSDFTTVAELAALGVRRISVGGALARTAWTGFFNAATEIAEHGTFSALGRAMSGGDINGRF
jgi:methylisocitrate lyase